MARTPHAPRAEPLSLAILERLAPPPPLDLVAARIESLTAPGDVVVDVHGRGGWIARAAVDGQRRAISLETHPLTRLLAEVVLRPPDLRHLDAAFQAMAGSPRRDTSLKLWVGERFTTRCATCERALILDEVVWEPGPDADATSRPVTKHYRCTICRDQRGGRGVRHAALDEQDLARAMDDGGDEAAAARRAVRERFPVPEGGRELVDDVLSLHTPRQLLGLAAILERIEGDLRAEPVEAALRLAFAQAILPAGRLAGPSGRPGTIRVHGGRLRVPAGTWRERDPWLAFEDGYRQVRGFLQRLESARPLPIVRTGNDLRALIDGPAVVSLRVATPSQYRSLAGEARDAQRAAPGVGARLILAQPPLRPSVDRIALAWVTTAWTLGREAASLLPLDTLMGPVGGVPWGWQSAALTRSLAAAAPMLSLDGRAVLLCEGHGDEALVSAVLGGIGAGYRLVDARPAEPGEDTAFVELIPPGAPLPPGPRTRANVPLPAVDGGSGDPDLLPARGLFAPPERFEQRPFSSVEAARAVTETAVEVIKARGEPVRTERLLGEILVGLDRAGHLRRLAGGGAGRVDRTAEPAATDGTQGGRGEPREDGSSGPPRATDGRGEGGAGDRDAPGRSADASEVSPRSGGLRGGGRPRARRGDAPEPGRSGGATDGSTAETPVPRADRAPLPSTAGEDAPGLWGSASAEREGAEAVDRLLGLIRDELGRPDQRRVQEVESGRWWLVDRADRANAAVPLADRVEWAVFSLLSTAGPMTRATFLERIAALFPGRDLPDEALVLACLESYRSRASTADRLFTADDLLQRTQEHTELLALLADVGHRLGFGVWLSEREQERPVRGRRLIEWMDDRERRMHLPSLARAQAADLAEVDAIWYIRSKATFHFEVEWTAMLGEPILRRHARIQSDDRTVRFLVVAPERTELIRHKLQRSPILRDTLETDGWHILKSDHLRTFAALEQPTLDALEPFLGLDPTVERSGEQLPLFGRS